MIDTIIRPINLEETDRGHAPEIGKGKGTGIEIEVRQVVERLLVDDLLRPDLVEGDHPLHHGEDVHLHLGVDGHRLVL